MLRYYYRTQAGDTVELTSYIDRRNPPTLKENAEEGSVAMSSVTIADPAMTLDLDGLRRFWAIEDDSEATDDVVFGGFIGAQEISRGTGEAFEPLGRVWTCEVVDANSIWNRRVMTGADCKRPAETDVDRVNWLFSSAESGIFDDTTTYVYSTPTKNMDKADYRGQYRDQVIGDCSQASGNNWWVQYQETGAGREWVVWYGDDGKTGYTSPLYLSNDPADWADASLLDGTSLVWPISEDTKCRRDPQRVYSGVYGRYEKGAVYRHDAATTADFCRRDFVAPMMNVKSKAKAINRVERLLEKLDTQEKRVTTRVRLPKGKATMIRAGMRIPFKATHIPGFSDDFYWTRVLSCAVTPHESGDFYDLDLELIKTNTGAASPPYAGEVMAGLFRSDAYGDALGYGYTLESPPIGWWTYATTGPIALDQASAPFTSVTVSAAMLVRIHAIAWASGVGGPAHTMRVLVNDEEVGSDSFSPAGGYWQHTFEVDLRNYPLQSGDTVTIGGTVSGAWTNFGTNSGRLFVGRGTFDFDGGGTDWEGP